jgi:hypothetical protein
MTDDRRYEHVTCPQCAQRWQRIDWGSAPHRLMCEAAATSPPFLDTAHMIETWQAEAWEDLDRYAGDRR